MKKIIQPTPPVQPKKNIISAFFDIPQEVKKYANFLFASISLITVIWTAGSTYGDLSHKITINTNDITEIKTNMVTYKSDINNSITEINDLNNRMWNNKFIIYFDHKNDPNIKTLLDMEDLKYKYEMTTIMKNVKPKTTKTTK